MDIDAANTTAVNRLMEARPILKGVATARDVIPGMKDNLFLHAGPPIEWARMSGPLRGAIIGAMLFEGIAKSEAEATSMIERGEAVGMILFNRQPEAAKSALNSFSVRSLPPVNSIITKSITFEGS